MADRHPSTEVLAAYLDNQLAPAERTDVEAHLAGCRACRRELIEAKHLEVTAPAPGARKTRRVVMFAASAAAVLLLTVLIPRNRAPVTVSSERRPNLDERSVVHTIAPVTENPVQTKRVMFVWHRDDAASYEMRISDSTGATLWSFPTIDTVAVLPDSVRLSANARYFWYVDALRPDGFSLTSGKKEFRTR